MVTSPYLLRILSKPHIHVDEWSAWYKDTTMPRILFKTKAARGGFYHAYNTFELTTKTPLDGKNTGLHDVQLTHTNLEPPADKICLTLLQLESIDSKGELFHAVDPGTERAISDIRVYKLIEDFDPRGLGYCK